MKTTTITASLMLEDAAKFPIMCQPIEITEEDFKEGMTHVYKMAAAKIQERLTVMIDEKSLKEFFE